MPANVSPCIPVRVKMRLQAAMLWAILSIPSILVTIILFISTNKSEFKKVSTYYVFYKITKIYFKVPKYTYTLISIFNLQYYVCIVLVCVFFKTHKMNYGYGISFLIYEKVHSNIIFLTYWREKYENCAV